MLRSIVHAPSSSCASSARRTASHVRSRLRRAHDMTSSSSSTLSFSMSAPSYVFALSTTATPFVAAPEGRPFQKPNGRQHRSYSTISQSISSGWSNPGRVSHLPKHDCRTTLRTTTRMAIRSKSVFVSKHNSSLKVSAKEIVEYCSSHGLNAANARTSASHVTLAECPFCSKPVNHKADNMYKCYIKVGDGAYFCHRCGSGGSWFDFKLRLSGDRFSVGSVSESMRGTGASAGGAAAPTRRTTKVSLFGGASGSGRSTSGKEGAAQARFEEFLEERPAQNVPCLPMPSSRLQALYSTQLLDQDPNEALDYLQATRGLEPRTLRKYGVGRATYSFSNHETSQWDAVECVTFPWLMSVADIEYQEDLRGAQFVADEPKGKMKSSEADAAEEKDTIFLTRRIKARALHNKSQQRLDPPGGGWGLFGYHTVPTENVTEIILTEGEYDAMAVWQATGRPAVSLPNGCRSLPVEVLPLLEHIPRIYLWMDNDAPGQEGADLFAKKLGLQRCYIVRPTQAHASAAGHDKIPKDANEALQMGMDLDQMLQDARLTPHESILSFDDLRDNVLHEICYPEKYIGVPLPSLPGFTKLVQGLRRGELTVLTGPTGSGKTTFLGQLSLDLAEQDINVLWGSFEIKNTRLMHKLLQQFAREPLPTGDPSMLSKLEALADRFMKLPMHFMKFHGGSDVDDVLDAMDYAVYVNDAEHIILDNMQFMISRANHGGSTFDKFDVQDMAIEKFRKFATDRNVHITLVVHPRKEHEGSQLSMASIYGSAKATQEADTVLILQKEGNKKYLDVKKNRFNGTLGKAPLHFDRQSCRYSENPLVNGVSTSDNSQPKQPTPAISAVPKVQAQVMPSQWDKYFNVDKT